MLPALPILYKERKNAGKEYDAWWRALPAFSQFMYHDHWLSLITITGTKINSEKRQLCSVSLCNHKELFHEWVLPLVFGESCPFWFLKGQFPSHPCQVETTEKKSQTNGQISYEGHKNKWKNDMSKEENVYKIKKTTWKLIQWQKLKILETSLTPSPHPARLSCCWCVTLHPHVPKPNW